MGVLERFNVELIGASIDAIRAGEDREEFKAVSYTHLDVYKRQFIDWAAPRTAA